VLRDQRKPIGGYQGLGQDIHPLSTDGLCR